MLSPKAQASLLRFVKVTVIGFVFLTADGAITFLTGNSLGLAPTYQSLVMVLAVPALTAAEKWATWQKSQQ
jgi:hypothetical protein